MIMAVTWDFDRCPGRIRTCDTRFRTLVQVFSFGLKTAADLRLFLTPLMIVWRLLGMQCGQNAARWALVWAAVDRVCLRSGDGWPRLDVWRSRRGRDDRFSPRGGSGTGGSSSRVLVCGRSCSGSTALFLDSAVVSTGFANPGTAGPCRHRVDRDLRGPAEGVSGSAWAAGPTPRAHASGRPACPVGGRRRRRGARATRRRSGRSTVSRTRSVPIVALGRGGLRGHRVVSSSSPAGLLLAASIHLVTGERRSASERAACRARSSRRRRHLWPRHYPPGTPGRRQRFRPRRGSEGLAGVLAWSGRVAARSVSRGAGVDEGRPCSGGPLVAPSRAGRPGAEGAEGGPAPLGGVAALEDVRKLFKDVRKLFTDSQHRGCPVPVGA